MLSATKQQILDFLHQNPDSSVKQIIESLDISKQAVSKHLRELLDQGLISKKGSPPKVYYSFKTGKKTDFVKNIEKNRPNSLSYSKIEENFSWIEPSGMIQNGWEGFCLWSQKRGFQKEVYAEKYLEIWEKYNSYKNEFGLIDATGKIQDTYQDQCFLNKAFYVEFSAYEIFGKTKIYAYLLYAKQSQNRKLIKEIIAQIKEKVLYLIIREKIDAVGFVPPSLKRQIQLMKELENGLNLPLPIIKMEKIKNDILVAQKTLKDPKDRIENAINTFVVTETRSFENILLIDDFLGSGATLNFLAQKLKAKFPSCKKVVGFAVSGTPNGVINKSKQFEVVSEV